MSDNIFDRLADLFRGSGPVNWRLAREISESAAGPAEPLDPWVAEEYQELAATAALHIEQASPLSAAGHSTPSVLDRRSWAGSEPESFSYIAEALADRILGDGPMPEMLAPLRPALVGLQVGGLTGALSQQVMAGFDIGIPEGDDRPPRFVVPNVEAFATDNHLDARQARLWVAMHELTHVAAMAIPWVREAAVMRFQAFLESLEVDEEGLRDRMSALQDPEALEGIMQGGASIGGLVALQGDAALLDEATAIMAVVEGYGDHLVARATSALVPEAERLRSALDSRRAEPGAGEQMLAQMLGTPIEHTRYRLGADFCSEIARRWGDEAVDRLWEGPESLPTASELEDPVGWAARVLL